MKGNPDEVIKLIYPKENKEEPRDVKEWINNPKWTKQQKIEELIIDAFYTAKENSSKFIGPKEESNCFITKKLIKNMSEKEAKSAANGLYRNLRSVEKSLYVLMKIFKEEEMTGSDQYTSVLANSFINAMNLNGGKNVFGDEIKPYKMELTKPLPKPPTKMRRADAEILDMVFSCKEDQINISDYPSLTDEILETTDLDFAKNVPYFPLKEENGTLLVAMNGHCSTSVKELGEILNRKVKRVIAKDEDILENINRQLLKHEEARLIIGDFED